MQDTARRIAKLQRTRAYAWTLRALLLAHLALLFVEPHNRHAADVAMLRAVICAGMYPRLVSVRARGRRNELKTHEDGEFIIFFRMGN